MTTALVTAGRPLLARDDQSTGSADERERWSASPYGRLVDGAELRWVRSALMRCHGLEDPKPIGTCFSVSHKDECGGNVWR